MLLESYEKRLQYLSEKLLSEFPSGWYDLINSFSDLEEAFRALEEYDSFHAESWRALVRGLQSRFGEAEEHLVRGIALMKTLPPTTDSFLHTILHLLFARLNGRWRNEIVPFGRLPLIPAYGSFGSLILHVHSKLDASDLLHGGQFTEALRLYEDFISAEGSIPELRCHGLVGAACCLLNLGRRPESEQHIEAALFYMDLCRPLDTLMCLQEIGAWYGYAGEAKKAREMRERIMDLPLDPEAKKAAVEKIDLMLDYSRQTGWLVVI